MDDPVHDETAPASVTKIECEPEPSVADDAPPLTLATVSACLWRALWPQLAIFLPAALLVPLADRPTTGPFGWLGLPALLLFYPACASSWLLSDYLITGWRKGRCLLDLTAFGEPTEKSRSPAQLILVAVVGTLVLSTVAAVAITLLAKRLGWAGGPLLFLLLDLVLLLLLLAERRGFRTYAEALQEKRAKDAEAARTGDEEKRKAEEREKRERRRGGLVIKELTEWLEEQKAAVAASVKDAEARDEMILALEQRYDELVKQKLKEMQP